MKSPTARQRVAELLIVKRLFKRNPDTGWLNYRITTKLEIIEEPDAYVLVTALPGLYAEDMRVRLVADFLVVDGRTRGDDDEPPKIGRYVRHVILPEDTDTSLLEFAYMQDLLLVKFNRLRTDSLGDPDRTA